MQFFVNIVSGDKSSSKSDALSLIIVELQYHSKSSDAIEISTFGHEGPTKFKVTKPAHYSDRIWASTNPNFLLSGQLSGFDSVDYRTKVRLKNLLKD